MLTKLPPFEKVYEAWSAIADQRVTMHEAELWAHVDSSDHSKTYEVKWDGNVYASSDSATYWQGYPGYPVQAVLMLQGKLPYDPEITGKFAGIPWKKLNDAHKRDYGAAAAEAIASIGLNEEELQAVKKLAKETNDALAGMDLTVKRGRNTHH